MGTPTRIGALVALVLAVGVGCGARSQVDEATPPPAPASQPLTTVHAPTPRLALIVMENREYDEVVDNPEAPFLNRLARRGTRATHYYAIAHPSLPNYLALLGGSTFGIRSDCDACVVEGENLANQLSRSGISWHAYLEGLPKICFRGATSQEYAKRHDPFMYFPSLVESKRDCRNVVSTMRLNRDLRNGSLPQFSWVSPGVCHDGHDCSLKTADRWLAHLVPRIVRRLGEGGVLFVTFDEGTDEAGCCGDAHGGRVLTIVAGPGARHGAVLRQRLDHYSLLATIESELGVPRLRQARHARTLRRAIASRTPSREG